MKTFLRLLRLIYPVRWHIALSLFFAWATVMSSAMLMACAGYLIATAALHPFIYELSLAIVGVRFFGILRAVLRYAERCFAHDATFRIITQLRVWCYQRLEVQAPAKLQIWQTGALFHLLTTSIERLQDFYLRVISPLITAFLVLIAVGGILLYFSPPAFFIFALAFLLIGLVVPMCVRQYKRLHMQSLSPVEARQKSLLLDGIEGIAELTIANKVESYLINLEEMQNHLAKLQVKEAKITALNHAIATTVVNLAYFFVLLVFCYSVAEGELSGVWLVVLLLTVQSSFEAAVPLPAVWQYGASTLAAAKSIFSVADAAHEPKSPIEKHLPTKSLDLVVKEVSFQYQQEVPVLKNLSVMIPAGKKIAIVGESGSGKSTLANLLLKFWEYEQGEITLGAVSYREMEAEDVRKYFCVVTQESHIFHTTLRENFLIVKPEATELEMVEVLKKVGLFDFVSSLAEGLDFIVGQNGQKLSGGERQRLILARALLKPTPILLLDEPTVNLDAKTAEVFMDTVLSNTKEQSLILITHQFAGLEKMDEIFVLADGRIVEHGNFTELLTRKHLFYQLWQYRNY